MSDKKLLTAADCAARYQVTTAQWRKMVSNNEAPGATAEGRKKLWPIDDLYAWKDEIVADLDATREQMLSAG